uniref:WSC domain containing 1b n=1 Tax=Scleropages formosus TaxID=113540 RepID=A0A8C9SB58_SCLFO
MAKPVYGLQRILWRTRLIFLFLVVAYIMAGSFMLLHGSGQSSSNQGAITLSIQPSQHVQARSQDRSGKGPSKRMVESDEIKVTPGQPRRNVRHKGTCIGCFLDDPRVPALDGTVFYDFRKMSSSLCLETCSESRYQFAGLRYGAECHCGNRVSGQKVQDKACSLDCKKGNDTSCEGVGHLSVYKVHRVAEQGYTNTQHRGCFKSAPNVISAFQAHVIQYNLTVESCVKTCTGKALPVAALRKPDCFCGHASTLFPLLRLVEEERCAPSDDSINPDHFQVYQMPLQDSKCWEKRFLPEKTTFLVALSSFPGAGNTWLRHLIELATGYYTGSFYFDSTLYNKGFRGEKLHWKSGRTICIKTHESGQSIVEQFGSAILLIRNPYRCLVAEFNRRSAGHLGRAPDERWGSEEWTEFVASYAPWWASHALDWLRFGRRTLVVHYEDLQGAPLSLVPQLRRITSFLNASVSEDRLQCTDSDQDGLFKRPGPRGPAFDPFTPDMKLLIDEHIRAVDKALRDNHHAGLPEEYLPR